MDLGDILGQKQKLVKHIEVQFSLAINKIKEPKKQTFEFHLQKGRKAFFLLRLGVSGISFSWPKNFFRFFVGGFVSFFVH